jgi:eukaryotic-like serine/threonine-protein kinase
VAAGTEQLTETGIAVGTPTYMSPEQAAGSKDVDGRSDLYSLGCVLYEMLSGEPPYTGPTPQAILAKKLSAPLPRISVVREAVPPGLEAALIKALARTPADRWRTAHELLTHLESLATPSGGTTPTLTRPTTGLGGLPRWARWVAGVGAVAVVAFGASQLFGPKPLNITASDMTQVTSEPGVEFQPAISPDGKEVAYVAGANGRMRLFVQSTANLAGGAAVLLADTTLGSVRWPQWSSDGDLVRFLVCRVNGCVLNETGRLGGAVRPATIPARAAGNWLVWSPDGTRVAFEVANDTIYAASPTGTGLRRVAIHPAGSPEIHSLAWSPDRHWIAYVNGNMAWIWSGNVAGSSIWIVDAGGGEPLRVTTDEYLNVSPAWLDASHLLFVSNRDGPRAVYVVAVGANGSRGEPRAVSGVADPHSISYSVSTHKLAYAKFTLSQNIWSYPLGRSTPVSIKDGQPITSGSQVIELSDVSPDGRWLAFDSNRRGNMDLYKVPLGGSDVVPLTAQPGDEWDPQWSPDGREIAFYAAAPGSPGSTQIMVMPADGGSPSPLTNDPGRNGLPSWSPSGLAMAFSSYRTGSFRPWILRRDSVGAAWHEAVPLTDFGCHDPVWTPDGSGVLCQVGNDLVLVSPQGQVLWRRDLSATSGLMMGLVRPRYARDGRTIYVTAAHREGRRGVWAIPVAGGTPRLVVAFDDPALSALGTFSIGPDHLYLTVSQYESDIWVANLHW